MAAARKIFLIAGEPSGDRLGASLMAGLKAEAGAVEFHGVGGPLMEAEGLKSLFPMSELSVMGIMEVLPKLPGLLRRVKEAVQAVLSLDPDVLVTIDSPDFCLRVAAKVKSANPTLKTAHYVAPTVWAWRPERAGKMARSIDHVLALLPFEPPYMEKAGMSCDFVGHPVVADDQAGAVDIAAFRRANGSKEGQKLIAVLPGSRRGEISRIGPVFSEVVKVVNRQRPETRFVVPAVAHLVEPLLEMLKGWPSDTILLDPRELPTDASEKRKRTALAASDLALAASGTVSLEIAAANTPMVIAYKFNWLTTRIIKRKVKLDTATLVNILTDTLTVPEFLFEDCTAENISGCVLDMLNNEHLRLNQKKVARESMQLLGLGGEDPGIRAAQSVLRFMDR